MAKTEEQKVMERNEWVAKATARGVPLQTAWMFAEYIVDQATPDSFGMVILSNDLMESFGWATKEDKAHMGDIVMFIYNDMPIALRGSKERVNAWLAKVLC